MQVNLERHNEKGCYSATTLLKALLATILSDRAFEKFEVRCQAISVWAVLFGELAVHSRFLKSRTDSSRKKLLSSELSHSKVNRKGGSLFDRNDFPLHDWKTCSLENHLFKILTIGTSRE